MFLGVSCIELKWGFLNYRKTWQLLLKIEHRGQAVVFCIYLQVFSMMRSISGQIFVLIHVQAMLKLLPFFNNFCYFQCYFFQKSSSLTLLPIETKLGMNVPWCILHRTDEGIFYLLKKKHGCHY